MSSFLNRSLVMLFLAIMIGCSSFNDDAKNTVSIGSIDRESFKRLTQDQTLAYEGLEFLGKGKVNKASNKFNEALRLNPMQADYHLLNALAYHVDAINGNAGAYDLAEQGYAMAIKFDASNWLAYYMQGRLYLDKGDFTRARYNLAQALLLEDSDPQLLKSMAYAAYRDGDAATAASMIERLKKLDQLHTAKDFQNAALIYSAVGEDKKADAYYDQMLSKEEPDWRADNIKRRIQDWSDIYHQSFVSQSGAIKNNNTLQGSLVNVSAESGGGTNYNYYFNPLLGEDEGGEDMPDSAKKMLVVDVVIIHTEELMGTSKGLNLLNGLKLQFGNQNAPAWSDERMDSDTTTLTQTGGGAAVLSKSTDVTDTITSAVSIPALSYSLNIFNSNNQRNEILARPTIVAMAGQRSEFFSGVELHAAAVSEGQISGQSVQIEKEIGVRLAVTPIFLEDGRIQLSVDAARTFLKTPNPDVNFTFRVETSKTTVNANVVMRYGETTILSGLSEKESESSRDGTIFLQDIPILQYLFSQKKTQEFQKSVLILLTPRPAQYVYQPENAKKEYEENLTEDERPMANLRARYADWFKPYPNWASVFKQLQHNSLYREFRTGDVELETWHSNESLSNRMKQSLEFLWY